MLVAGSASHRFGEHEHYAGCRLLADRINRNVPGLHAMVSRDGWPEDPTAFDHADAIIFYCDGGSGHPVNDHLQTVREWIPSGVGLGAIHYAVEVPKGEPGSLFLTGWGGYFETFWSVNPHWKALIKRLPTQDRQVKKVIKILQRMAMLSYKKKSAMPKNLKAVLWGI